MFVDFNCSLETVITLGLIVDMFIRHWITRSRLSLSDAILNSFQFNQMSSIRYNSINILSQIMI